MRFFSILASIAAVTSALEIAKRNNDNAAGNPLCDQTKEIETQSDRQWKRLQRAHRINRVTRGENQRRQDRNARKERDGQIKARAAARAIARQNEAKKAAKKKALAQHYTKPPTVGETPKSESDTSSDSDPDPPTPAPAPAALHQRRSRAGNRVDDGGVGRERDDNGDTSETDWETWEKNRGVTPV